MANKKGTSSSTSVVVSGINATPIVATKVVVAEKGAVKVSTPALDVVTFASGLQAKQDEAYADLILSSINAREISSVSSVRALVTSNPNYQPIKNLAKSNFDSGSTRIAPNINNETSFFGTLAINIASKIPSAEELVKELEIDENGNPRIAYFDETLMTIIVNLKNIIDEDLEVSFISFNSLNDDTIY